ncbi:MAG: hypothetical protein LBP39_02185 [Rickettsiales bacterium]|jgi:hypothetical protein|nr:hypothetical protein [Rickettsiales bacterium]
MADIKIAPIRMRALEGSKSKKVYEIPNKYQENSSNSRISGPVHISIPTREEIEYIIAKIMDRGFIWNY